MRRAKGLPSFRVDRLHRLLREAIRETRREGFRIVHDSIQNDQITGGETGPLLHDLL